MSRVWATGRESFGLMPVSAAKVAIKRAIINQVSQVTRHASFLTSNDANHCPVPFGATGSK